MAGFETFAKDIQLATAGIAPEAIGRELAKLARSELARVIRSGEGTPTYDRYVNGRLGAIEESVLPPGPILYVFSLWKPVVAFALNYLRGRSPVDSGLYRDSHVALINFRPVDMEAEIPVGAEVVITNPQPYSRKIQVGAMKMSVSPGIYEDARKAVSRQFGGRENGLLDIRVSFLNLPRGSIRGTRVPWILRNTQVRDGKPRRDAMEGMPIKYPALVMSMRG